MYCSSWFEVILLLKMRRKEENEGDREGKYIVNIVILGLRLSCY